MKKLVTRLPNYSQNVADLKESVLFDNISLTSANGRVSVQVRNVVIDVRSSSNVRVVRHIRGRSILIAERGDQRQFQRPILPRLAHRKRSYLTDSKLVAPRGWRSLQLHDTHNQWVCNVHFVPVTVGG